MQTLERKTIKQIDFNCDLAQSFGVYKNRSELNLIRYASSVNVSCGFHAGDPVAINEALKTLKEYNVVVGAHIGFNDIQGFGYREMNLSDDEIESIVIYQVGALMSFAKTFNLEIEHVRPHGAMYKLASENFEFSKSIAKAIQKCSKWLVYYGAAGENIERVASETNIPIAREVFLEKIYNSDGSIDSQARDVENTEICMRRLRNILAYSQVQNNEGGKTFLNIDTVHFSSKLSNSEEMAKSAYEIITPTPVNYKNVYESGWV
jgi:UPF0271 protein